jgi:MFS family permease
MSAGVPARRTRFNSDLRRLFAAQAFSSIGDSLLQIAVVIMIYRITRSAAQVAVLYAVMVLPATSGMVLGPIIARFPQRSLLIVCDLVRAMVLAVAPLLVVSGNLAALYAGLVIVSALGTAFQSSRMTVMATAAHGTPLSRVNGFDSTTVMVGQLCGLAAGGGLVVVNYRWALWIDAGTFVVSAAFLARLTVGRAAPGGGRRTDLVRALRNSYGYIVRTPVLSYNIFGNTLFNLGVGVFNSMLVIYCYRELHGGSAYYTAMEISQLLGITLGGVALAYLLRPLRLGGGMFVGNAVTGVAIAALGLVDRVSAAVVLGAVIGVANVLATSISRTMLMAASNSQQRPNVMSVRMALGRPVNTLGAALGAALVAWVSTAAVRYVAGLVIVAFAVLGLLVPAVRTFREQEEGKNAPQRGEEKAVEGAAHA